MKRLRVFLVSLFSLAFALAQVPSVADAQILALTNVSQCTMLCCRHLSKSMPMPAKCPMFKMTAEQLDAIFPNVIHRPNFSTVLIALPKAVTLEAGQSLSHMAAAISVLQLLFFEQPSIGRAPPADIAQLSA